jgi:heavy metal sensor kinase
VRSIRLWLLVYFLLLLAVALGAVSAYVYRLTQQTLLAKETSVRELVEARYKEKCRQYEEDFDESILRRAHILASLAQTQWGTGPRFCSASVLTAGLGQHSTLAVPAHGLIGPVGAAEFVDGPGAFWLPPLRSIQIHYAEDVFPRYAGGYERDYFQVHDEAGKTLQRSDSLADVMFILNPEHKELQLFESAIDDAEVRPGVLVRRVTLKAPVTRSRTLFPRVFSLPPPTQRDGHREGRRKRDEDKESPGVRAVAATPKPQVPSKPWDRAVPQIFIQCARETTRRDAELAAFKQQLDNDIGRMEQESQAALASLRRQLLLLSFITFAATVVGGVWLVQLGLSPIERITHAVSQVSAKNFELPLASDRVPAELAPIVDKLKEALDSLKRAFEREKQAAADISHELRTPIAALMATTEVCLRKDRSSKEYRDTLHACQEIGEQLSVLVERLLTLARLDAGADQLRSEPVDVPELAEQCLSLVRPLAEERGLGLRLERNGPAIVHTDAGKLREVVINLLHNAIQYNRPNGKVELRVERDNGQVNVAVKDTGVGIPPHARQHLFERFYRVDPSRHSDAMHAGLGLAIVKGYLDLMGGTIAVESVEGEGTTFRVSLPLEKHDAS